MRGIRSVYVVSRKSGSTVPHNDGILGIKRTLKQAQSLAPVGVEWHQAGNGVWIAFERRYCYIPSWRIEKHHI